MEPSVGLKLTTLSSRPELRSRAGRLSPGTCCGLQRSGPVSAAGGRVRTHATSSLLPDAQPPAPSLPRSSGRSGFVVYLKQGPGFASINTAAPSEPGGTFPRVPRRGRRTRRGCRGSPSLRVWLRALTCATPRVSSWIPQRGLLCSGNRLDRNPGMTGTHKHAASPACVAADRLLITGSQGTRELPSGGHGTRPVLSQELRQWRGADPNGLLLGNRFTEKRHH